MSKRVQTLIDLGQARIASDGWWVIGIASDGCEVTLGDLYDEAGRAALDSYLTANPTPDTW